MTMTEQQDAAKNGMKPATRKAYEKIWKDDEEALRRLAKL